MFVAILQPSLVKLCIRAFDVMAYLVCIEHTFIPGLWACALWEVLGRMTQVENGMCGNFLL